MDWSLEYSEAMRLMGLRDTDLHDLLKACATAAVRAPEPYSGAFATLVMQIERRITFMVLNPPPPHSTGR